MSKSYSFLDVAATLVGPGGFISLGSGAAVADEGISFAYNGDIDGMLIGSDGEGVHSLHADLSGTVTVRLLKNSPTNQLLSAMVAFQRTGAASWGQNTIECRDRGRGDVWVCSQVAFKKLPDVTYAKDADIITWEFNAIRMQMTLGS
jgi:hypothetical protein